MLSMDATRIIFTINKAKQRRHYFKKLLIGKTIPKFEKKLSKTKSSYSFQDRGTDRQTESISECTLKDLSNDI